MSVAGPPEQVEHAVGRLVVMGTRSERVGDLLSFLSSTLQRPSGVVDARGHALASAAPGALARDGLDAALGAIERDLGGHAPSGWQLLPLQARGDPGGHLVLPLAPLLQPDEQTLVEVARALIADQLRRAAMARRILDERRSALKRRVVGDGRPTPRELVTAGEQAHMPLAECYWPAIVSWEPGELDATLLAGVEQLLHRHAPEHVAVCDGARALVVLVAQEAAGTEREAEAEALVDQVAALVRAGIRGAHVGGILARASVPLADVPLRVEELRRLSRCLERHRAPTDRGVHSESTFAFLGLIAAVDRRRAAAFVDGQIGALLGYDRAHGTHLADVLELALDLPHRADAAQAAYMHRNTFRRYLEHATALLGADLDDPDERLAVHVALKLTDLLGIQRDRPLPGAIADPDPVRAAPGGLARHGGWSESPFRSRVAGESGRRS